MLGSYEINVHVGKNLPQKLATYFDGCIGKLLGATYSPIAYLGSQVVNGTNHAILCEQVLTTGRDTKNVVLLILNEKDEGVSLVGITPVVESGGPFGGTTVDVKTEIPSAAKAAFDGAFEKFVGTKITPFALLGTQVVHGLNYIYAAEVSAVIGYQHGYLGGSPSSICKITLNDATGEVTFDSIL